MSANSPRIGVFGAGAVGGYVGGHLTLAGYDVTLIGRTPPLRGAIPTIASRGIGPTASPLPISA